MREVNFQQEIARSFRLLMPDAFYYKIPDPQYPKRTEEGDAIRRIIPRPYDCQVIDRGKFFAIELKLHKRTTAFPIDAVKENQLHSLQRVNANGGTGIILINARTRNANLIYALSVDEYLSLSQHHTRNGRKSIPYKAFADIRHVYGRHHLPDRRYGWDVRQILNDMKGKW